MATRIFHIEGDRIGELAALPDAAPANGYLWVSVFRDAFEALAPEFQAAMQRWTGGQLVDLHVADLLNVHLASHFDYTSWYDLLVFRRLAALQMTNGDESAPPSVLDSVDTSPVGFAVFDHVLLTVHPADCPVRDFFANRLQQQAPASEVRASVRTPPNPADLMLRMVNHIDHSYLDLRRLLTRQLDHWQRELFSPAGQFAGWQTMLDSRNRLHLLEDTCEDQRAAITEWIDALDELPAAPEPAAARERELLRVRSSDVLEHIERVLTHVRRLESSAEAAVQMHFAAQSHRTNNIMRTLTVLTAIFMPLNLVTGFFGMNFEGLPLIHSHRGFWVTFALMLIMGVGLSWFFWRKRYLGRSR